MEEGAAKADINGLDWTYTATAVNASLNGDKFTVEAIDKPGNLTTKQQTL